MLIWTAVALLVAAQRLMDDEMKFLDGRKSYGAAVGLVLTALGGYLSGDLTVVEAAVLVLNGLGIGGLRHAQSKGK